MPYPLARIALLAGVAAFAGCGGGGTRTIPPIAADTPTPVPGSTAGADALVPQAASATQSVMNLYAALPHAGGASDVPALAQSMVASGQFRTATVTPGGISAQLADGTPFLVFADHVDDPATSGSSSAARAPRSALRRSVRSVPASQHLVALLVNTTDTTGPFNPQRQQDFAAVLNDSLGNSAYSAFASDVQLSTIASLRGSHVDWLEMDTHGEVAIDAANNPYYIWMSDTPVSSAAMNAFSADFKAGRIMYAVYLPKWGPGLQALTPQYWPSNIPLFAFTPAFLLEYASFNPGAIVVNASCHGQNPKLNGQVGAMMQTANVGRYFGWDDWVHGPSSDQTDAFIYDRLLGEGSTKLSAYVGQQSAAQRAFPLDDVQKALRTETRLGILQASSTLTYAKSYGSLANFVISDFGGENVPNAPIFYALPSIARMEVAESPGGGTLTIYGRFPAASGHVDVVDGSNADAFTPTSWSTGKVVVTLPASGQYSKGYIVVVSADGITSNFVPLTQWSGQLTSVQNNTFNVMSGYGGSGSGVITVTYNVNFRADVHPTVPSIDASPVPQNLYFAQPEADSAAQVTAITGTFTSGDGKHSAVFGLGQNLSGLPAAAPPLPPAAAPSNTFAFGALSGQPSACNNAKPGPQQGPTNVLCPEIGYTASAAGTCSDNDGTVCVGATWTASGTFGAPGYPKDGLLQLIMDPTTYAITISASTASGFDHNFGINNGSSTGTISGTIGSPAAAPNSLSLSDVRRRALGIVRSLRMTQ